MPVCAAWVTREGRVKYQVKHRTPHRLDIHIGMTDSYEEGQTMLATWRADPRNARHLAQKKDSNNHTARRSTQPQSSKDRERSESPAA